MNSDEPMTFEQSRGIFKTARQLGYSDDEARALLSKGFTAAFEELSLLIAKTRPPWQAPLDFPPSPIPPRDLGLTPDRGPHPTSSRICLVSITGKYRELTTADEPPSPTSLWHLNNLVDVQETGILGSKTIDQWLYPDGKPDNWGFRPAS